MAYFSELNLVHVGRYEATGGSLIVRPRVIIALISRGLRSCRKVKVAVVGSPSLVVYTVSVNIKQH